MPHKYVPSISEIPNLIRKIIENKGGQRPIGPAKRKKISAFTPPKTVEQLGFGSDWKSYIISQSTKRLPYEELVKLLYKQNCRCAVTGIKLTNGTNNLTNAVIDVINETEPRKLENIQWVAAWYRRARWVNTHREMADILQNIQVSLFYRN